jgi:hypothetical protein
MGPLYILLLSTLIRRTKNVGATQTNGKKKYKPKNCSGQLRSLHNKLHGSQFDNNSCAKFVFQRFVWSKHLCHSPICIV